MQNLPNAMRNILSILLCIALISACSGNPDCASCSDENAEHGPRPATGLSNQCVYDIAEDTSGQIWIATFRGLNRYDSRDFYHYFSDYPDSLSLPSHQVRDLLIDHKGRLLIASVAGVCRHTESDNFHTFPELRHQMALKMIKGPDSLVFILASNALYSLDVRTDSIETLIDSLNLPMTVRPRMVLDSRGALWVSGSISMLRYDYRNHRVADSIPIPMYANNAFPFGDDILLSGQPGNIVFEPATRRFKELPGVIRNHAVLGSAELNAVEPYGDSAWLFQTANDGIFLYDSASGSIMHQSDNGFPIDAPDFKVSTIFADSRGNIWFGGVDQGIDVHYHYIDRFNTYSQLRHIFSGKSVNSTDYDTRGNLWASTTNDGFFVYDNARGTVRNFSPEDFSFKAPGKDLYVHFLFADSKGFIWLLMTSGEILRCRYDSASGLHVENRYNNIWGSMEMEEDSRGTFWIGTGSPHMAYLDEGASAFTPMQVFEGYCFVPSIIQYDDNSMLAAGFNQPLKKIDMRTKEISLLPVEEPVESVLTWPIFIPTDICRGADGTLWIGTVGNGLLRYDPDTRRFTSIPGAPCEDISAIKEDSDGNLWISTLYGLSHYRTADNRFTSFFDFDGIGGNQFYDRSAAVSPDSSVFVFGGTHGITSVDVRNVDDHVEAPLLFQYLKVHNDIVRPGKDSPIPCALSQRPQVVLKNRQNSFSIGFVAVDFCENPRVSYLYKLEGVDRTWREASQNHEASYANVDAGDYIFRLRLADDTGGTGEIALRIRILPSPWLSWWAIMIYILLGILLSGIGVYFFMKIRAERRARLAATREKEQERRINDMNMRFFANVSHEFRTPLTMISGPIKQLAESPDLPPNDRQLISIAKTNVDRMLKLVNQLLDFNKLENDTLRLEVADMDVPALLRDVTMSFALAAKYKHIEFTTVGFEMPFGAPADADKLIKIYCNLLSNALKFTPKGGRIKVKFDIAETASGRRMVLIVENTGRRIPSDKLEKIFQRYYQLEDDGHRNESTVAGSGIGLYYARALAELHHGSLRAVQPEAEGACFVLELPADDIYADDEHRAEPSQLDSYPIEDNVYAENSAGADDELNTILVVDDDIQVANYIRVLLAPVYKVVTMFDAESALEWLAENSPAMIISDVVMPGMDGYEFCRRVKANLELCHIPVLLVTAKASVENQVEGFEAEANAYITKPFDPALLMSLIGSLLKNRDRARQLATTSTSVEGVEPEIMAPQDSAFLTELYQLMEKELSNSELDINNISHQLRMSRTKFYYKVKGLTGQTPAVFFRTYKLNRAAELIAGHRYTLSEIADMTGFSTLSHFSRSFKNHFGTAPSSYDGTTPAS